MQWVTQAVSRGVKQQGRDSNQVPPLKDEVKNEWTYTPLLHMPSWQEQDQMHHKKKSSPTTAIGKDCVYFVQGTVGQRGNRNMTKGFVKEKWKGCEIKFSGQ